MKKPELKATVIGLGLIGGSVALDLRARGFATHINGVELSEQHQKQARDRGLVDDIQSLDVAIQNTDLVILTIPVDGILKILPKILDKVGDEVTITDMGSTKALISSSVRNHPRRKQYVSSHPMAGTEHSGPLAALRGLFDFRTAVICDASESGAFHLRRIDEMYEVLKMRRVYMASSEHDLHAAFVSHLSHISSFVLANTVLEKQKNVGAIFDLAGGGFESTVRLAKSSPEMWTPIFEQNSNSVIDALKAYIDHLQVFHQSLVTKKFDQTKEIMKEANKIRQVLKNLGQGVEK
jgi:prephenate dehydrogenase